MFVDKPKNANFVLTNKYTQLSTLYHLCVQKAKLNAHKVYNTLKLLNNTNLESDFYWGGGTTCRVDQLKCMVRLASYVWVKEWLTYYKSMLNLQHPI